MPLDRRITVQRTQITQNEFAEDVETTTLFGTVWAERSAGGSVDTLDEGGVIVTSAVNWTVRFTTELLAIPVNEMSVVDEYGVAWNVDTVQESDARRRFISIGAVREVI